MAERDSHEWMDEDDEEELDFVKIRKKLQKFILLFFAGKQGHQAQPAHPLADVHLHDQAAHRDQCADGEGRRLGAAEEIHCKLILI